MDYPVVEDRILSMDVRYCNGNAGGMQNLGSSRSDERCNDIYLQPLSSVGLGLLSIYGTVSS